MFNNSRLSICSSCLLLVRLFCTHLPCLELTLRASHLYLSSLGSSCSRPSVMTSSFTGSIDSLTSHISTNFYTNLIMSNTDIYILTSYYKNYNNHIIWAKTRKGNGNQNLFFISLPECGENNI